MKVSELQVILESIVGDHGDHVEVRVAIQPSWPFEHEIGNVSAVESEGKTVLYIGEGKQIGTLPQIVQKDLLWAPWGP